MGCDSDFSDKFGHHAGDAAKVTTIKTSICVSVDIGKQLHKGERVNPKKLVKTVLKEMRDGGLWTASNTLADYTLEELGVAALKNEEVSKNASQFISTINDGGTILTHKQKNDLLRNTEIIVEGIRGGVHIVRTIRR